MKYHPEIDGLRTVAVAPVILFHAGFSGFGGGYVGVDVFFVISGFLITSILISDLEQGTFSILKFYERRMRRILPALFVVVLACIPFAWVWLLPSAFKDFSQSVAAVGLFASNFLFWFEVDYFDTSAERKPLLHTWSLAVEEQYYIVFPVLLAVIWRLGQRSVFGIISVLALLSLAYTVVARSFGWASDAALFYLPFSRAWELFAGSLCAMIMRRRSLSGNDAYAAVGLGLIIFAIFFFDKHTPFPSAYTVVPIVGTALVLLFARPEGFVGRFLSVRPMVQIGLISYSAYLWHQPLFAFARVRSLEDPSHMTMGALAVLTLGLAYLTWKFVEQPFRKKPSPWLPKRGVLLSVSAMCLASLVVFGTYGHVRNGFSERFQIAGWSQYEFDRSSLQVQSWRLLRNAAGNNNYGVDFNAYDQTEWFPDTDRPLILVVGNSHSKGTYNALTFSQAVVDSANVARFGTQIFDLLDPIHPFFASPNFEAADVILISTRYTEDDIAALPAVVSELRDAGKKVLVVNNTPEFLDSGNATLADSVLLSETSAGSDKAEILDKIATEHWDAFVENDPVSEIRRAIAHVAEENDIPLLDRADLICDRSSMKCFAVDEEGQKIIYDYGHITLAGAAFLGRRMDKGGWLDPIMQPTVVSE
ncbi:Peptidoglycan/LPS O-acetylase OafA/YrhL, contains acyltransferase and SGNH-hydrolase domains [Cognatiyoonia sediminum]|uniref:Peptidoglycan/LPS O-acetylase OafA/YrhL, contains acyltransferase and SGNH-hydrolase domains n=1 Tax=Cognatiyoonia sediminum TaxID=1508389 RepID=A0A1M5QVT8_9RHOB|nr:acyltransferase family protein [Cognatiyoonia sediminum]SHH18264.1 Peptidoglycan/LPS O-acetylase OafA/YrhL, contains acyltransferase and SGNH-hydrolase domains [Cognatiyoonia sediminum]